MSLHRCTFGDFVRERPVVWWDECGRVADCAFSTALQQHGERVVSVCLKHLAVGNRGARLAPRAVIAWQYETIGQVSAARKGKR